MESDPERTINEKYMDWLEESKIIDTHHIISNTVRWGTDMDWIVEKNWNFIIFEMKHFSKNNTIDIKYPAMQTLYRLYTKLSDRTNVVFFFIGYDDIHKNDNNSEIYYFHMYQWIEKKIPVDYDKSQKRYRIKRSDMTKTTLQKFKKQIEIIWKGFEDRPTERLN